MDVAVEILDVHLHPIRDSEDTILFYIERTSLTITSLLVRYTMCILLTPVLYFITTVLIECYLQCFTESVSLRDIGKPTSRAEISSPSSLYFKAEKGAHLGSALVSSAGNMITGILIEACMSDQNFFMLTRSHISWYTFTYKTAPIIRLLN